MKIGIDIGSKNISAVIVDTGSKRIIRTFRASHNGDIASAYENIYGEMMREFKPHTVSYGITGNLDLPDIKQIDRILAAVESNRLLKTFEYDCNPSAIIDLGNESYSLIILDDNGDYVEHAVNPLCASGTGSFLEQQAERLGLSIETLSDMAFGYAGNTPSIATRCAVFAKSDIIHAQSEGYSKEAIAAGLCEGIADSILSNLIKGRKLSGHVIFSGGLSKNRKIISVISGKLGIKPVLPESGLFFGAIGAALLSSPNDAVIKPENISAILKVKREKRSKLDIDLPGYPDFTLDRSFVFEDVEVTEYSIPKPGNISVYLGIDIGSTSTKAVVTDSHNTIIAGFYTKTKGEPVAAVSKLMKAFSNTFSGHHVNLLGAGTTGSGRKLVKSILNADIEINEITAHAKSAVFIDGSVDTIIEIGGQDSKFTLLKDGNVVNASMNYVCAAGTGSFIEEQALRLGVKLDEISDLVTGKEAPYTSDRCTVYMERDLNIFMAEGWNKSEILASVLYSVRDNYLSKVVGKAGLGKKIFFQGATARNKALVSVFKEELKTDIIVSKYCHLTGALGVALILNEKKIVKSGFAGMDFKFFCKNEVCNLCINKCELNVYEVNGRKTAWGLKCGREYEDNKFKKEKTIDSLNDTFIKTFAGLEKNQKNIDSDVKTIGIPLSLYLIEYYPLFKNFFEQLGFKVVCEKNTREKIKAGLSSVNSDFCAPLITAAGTVAALLKRKVDYIFFPSFISDTGNKNKPARPATIYEKDCDDYFCYYSEYAPDIIFHLPGIDADGKILSPSVKFNRNEIGKTASSLAVYLSSALQIDESLVEKSFIECYEIFEMQIQRWKEYGNKILAGNPEKPKILFLGRPYSAFDDIINLDLPSKFEDYGFDILYQSMLELDLKDLDYAKRYYNKMHWHYGQEILLAAEYAAKSRNVYPVFLTCFRCSPDSFLITYFRDIMDSYGKPYLVIQLDEHESDVGYLTRIEAAVDTFKGDMRRVKTFTQPLATTTANNAITKDLTVMIPYLSDVISNLQRSCFEAAGFKAMVLPLEQKSINTGYRYASGSECMPVVSVAGSLIDTVKNLKLDPEKTILYMPSACIACNFNQFATFIDYTCRKAGLEKIKISNSNALRQLPELPKELNNNLFEVGILGSLLYKLYYRCHPYEEVSGETRRAFDGSYRLIIKAMNEKTPLLKTASEIRSIFESIKIKDIKRKPRIGVIGDLYLKYNIILNQDIYSLIEELDGEIVIPSFTETVAGLLDADARVNGLEPKYRRGLVMFEKHYEKVFQGMLDDVFEPSLEECYDLSKEFGIMHHIPGETAINIGRMLYYIKHKTVDAAVHLNPVFCCPGVVTSSIFRKIQKDSGIPIIDIFYDGTNKPNRIIIPRLFYLNGQKKKNDLN